MAMLWPRQDWCGIVAPACGAVQAAVAVLLVRVPAVVSGE